MKKIMIVILGISLFLEANFSRNDSKGIVTDNITKLQWQDDYGANNPEVIEGDWEYAIDYCNALTLGGYSDWRLPNINELTTIVDFDVSKSPLISNVFVYIAWDDWYWSSTTSTINSVFGWSIGFEEGGRSNISRKSANNYVRCVRGE